MEDVSAEDDETRSKDARYFNRRPRQASACLSFLSKKKKTLHCARYFNRRPRQASNIDRTFAIKHTLLIEH